MKGYRMSTLDAIDQHCDCVGEDNRMKAREIYGKKRREELR